jgi:signal transduction histidine kinase
LNANAQQKNIELNNLVDPGTIIYADENMLQSILMNLCGNAIKFTNRDGIVKIYCTEEKDNFVILVEDNGLGISKLNLKNLLKENSYFSTYGTAKERGTGLGLILCKEFIEKHSGKIWVESCEGKGTTFYFTIAKKII